MQLYHLAKNVEDTFNKILEQQSDQRQKEFLAKKIVESIQFAPESHQYDQMMHQQISPDFFYQQQLQKILLENPQALQMILDPQMSEVFQRLAQTEQLQMNQGFEMQNYLMAAGAPEMCGNVDDYKTAQ